MVIIKDGVLHAVPVGERTQRAPHTPSVARQMAPTALVRRVLQVEKDTVEPAAVPVLQRALGVASQLHKEKKRRSICSGRTNASGWGMLH